MSDTNELDDTEKLVFLWKSYLGFPNTNESLPFYSEVNVPYNNYVFAGDLLLNEIPESSTYVANNIKAHLNLTSDSISHNDCVVQNDNQTPNLIRKFVKLKLIPIPNSNDANGNFRGWYVLDNTGTNILQNSIQFNIKKTPESQPYPYKLFTSDSNSGDAVLTERLINVENGNWIFDIKNGVLNFPDVPTSTGFSLKQDANLYLSFFKYVGPKGIQNFGGSKWEENKTNADNIYYSDGNVGIGTDNPTSLLDVCGNALIRNDLTVSKINSSNGILNVTGQDTSFSKTSLVRNIYPVSISRGTEGGALLLNTGEVKTWGNGGQGRLGNNSTANSSQLVSVSPGTSHYNGSNAISISCGEDHKAIVLSNGAVVTFGNGSAGKLGYGSEDSKNTPVNVVNGDGGFFNGTNAIGVSCGTNHTAVLLKDGRVVTFGSHDKGQLGNGANTRDQYNIPFSSKKPVNVATTGGYDGNAISISCGDNYTAILLNTGQVVCFGGNDLGQLGDETYSTRTSPVAVKASAGYDGSNAVGVSCGEKHTAILLNTGKVVTFGKGEYGQLGDNTSLPSYGHKKNLAIAVVSGNGYSQNNAIRVACGAHNTGILLNNGKVVTFGENGFGQLGIGTNVPNMKSSPQAVSTGGGYQQNNAIDLCFGSKNLSILLDDGKMVSCGTQIYGSLADGESLFIPSNYGTNALTLQATNDSANNIAAIFNIENNNLQYKLKINNLHSSVNSISYTNLDDFYNNNMSNLQEFLYYESNYKLNLFTHPINNQTQELEIGLLWSVKNPNYSYLKTNGVECITMNSVGNVGIGTTPPTNSERLHVHGNVHATGFIQAATDVWGNNVKVNNQLTIGATNSAQIVMKTNEINCDEGLHLQYQTGSENLSLCNGGGNVGIGTDNPQTKLHVKNGRITVEGYVSEPCGVLELINYNTNINYIFTEGNNLHGQIGDLVFQTAYSNKNFIFDRGNVGIGTNNPENLLHVNGGVTIGASNGAYIVMKTNEINCDEGLNLQYQTDSGNLSLCNGGGTVAIGTTPPTNSERLHVHGNVYATGFIYYRGYK
jgi:alpha-tubulin suppressor-like RCC1 family protein